MATAKASVVATDQAAQQEFYDNEHPIAEDLSNIPKQAYEMVSQLVWNALSDRNGVLSGLTCTFAGGDAIVTVGDGSLIMQGNMAQHASANYTHTGANGTWYLYARPQEEADTTTADDRSFVVANRPIPFSGVSPATGETPDGSKKTFRLQHYRVITQTFRAYVDGDAVGCTVSNSTGTGGYAEAHFVDAPGGATTVTFDYDQETGGYGTVQSVDTQNKVSLEFSSNAGAPPRTGYVCLCRYTVAGGNVTAVTETGFKEWLFHYDSIIGSDGPGGYKKVIDFLRYLDRGDTLAEYLGAIYTAGMDVELSSGYGSFGADLTNGSTTATVSNQTQYDSLKAGMTFFVSNGAGSFESIGGSYFDAYRILYKSDSVGGTGGDITFDTAYLGTTRTQTGNFVFVAIGSTPNPIGQADITNLFVNRGYADNQPNDCLTTVNGFKPLGLAERDWNLVWQETVGYFNLNATPSVTEWDYFSDIDALTPQSAGGGIDGNLPPVRFLDLSAAAADTDVYLISMARVRIHRGTVKMKAYALASITGLFPADAYLSIRLYNSSQNVVDTATISFSAITAAAWHDLTGSEDLEVNGGDPLTSDTDFYLAITAHKDNTATAKWDYSSCKVYELFG